jgi:hypothetical protein
MGEYPTGYLDPLALDTAMYDKSRISTETYSCSLDMHRTCYLTSHVEDNIDFEYPHKYQMLYRYTGEDVKMICAYRVKEENVTGAKKYSP